MDEFRVLARVNTAVLVVILARLLICGKKHLRETYINDEGSLMEDKNFLITDGTMLDQLVVKNVKSAIQKAKEDGVRDAKSHTEQVLKGDYATFPNIKKTIDADAATATKGANEKLSTSVMNAKLDGKLNKGECLTNGTYVEMRDGVNNCLLGSNNDNANFRYDRCGIRHSNHGDDKEKGVQICWNTDPIYDPVEKKMIPGYCAQNHGSSALYSPAHL